MEEATLYREPLAITMPPAQAALALRGDNRPFALIGAWAGGRAVLGSEPVRVANAADDLFAVLDELPAVLGAAGAAPSGRAPGAVGGGWFGFLGFELRHRVEPGDPPPPRPMPLPAGALAYYDHVLRLDGAGRWWFEALMTAEREPAVLARCDALRERLAAPPDPRPFTTRDWGWVPSPAGHAATVQACRARIAEGDLFQANLCLRLEGRIDGDALDLFATAATALPTDRAAFVAGPWGMVASLSPELFLARTGRTVRSAPIKGTRPAERRVELEGSEKDRAENVMIVDLVRNDLGRVCRPGAVRVTALAEVRPHAGVWHMVSEVEGELRDGVRDADLLRAAFPPGSVTGAPKLAALAVIAELESTGREAYTGAIGFASPLAGLELNVAIRTFEFRGSRVWLGAGGGIVADSDPEAEAREAAAKAAPLLAAISATPPQGLTNPPQELTTPPPGGTTTTQGVRPLGTTTTQGVRPLESRPLEGSDPLSRGGSDLGVRIVRRGPRPVPRPDPAAGLYETVRVEDGVALDLEPHFARLAASYRALYGRTLPDDLAARAAAAAAGQGRGRLRIDLTPDGQAAMTVTPPGPGVPVTLRPVVLPGGIGPHKWRDRRLLESHEADEPATMPLLLDADGLVLETSRASVVVRAPDGTLHTPPRDGRILPGVTATLAGAIERRLTLTDLAAAETIYVASALRGLQPALLAGR